MTTFKPGDRVRLKGNAAYALPDRRNKVGTVLQAWTDPTNIVRLEVLFDGEEQKDSGLADVHYEHVK